MDPVVAVGCAGGREAPAGDAKQGEEGPERGGGGGGGPSGTAKTGWQERKFRIEHCGSMYGWITGGGRGG